MQGWYPENAIFLYRYSSSELRERTARGIGAWPVTCPSTSTGQSVWRVRRNYNTAWHGRWHEWSWWVRISLQWRHNDHDSVSNHQPYDCLLNRLFRRRSKKTSKLRVTGLCAGNSPGNSPHKWPVTRKMFPFDDVIMYFFKSLALALMRMP